MPVLRALHGLSDTIHKGFKQRGDMALGGAKMNLESEKLDYAMRMDKLDRKRQEEQDALTLPGKQVAGMKAEKEMAEQEELNQPASMKDVSGMFKTNLMTPLNSLHFNTNVLPALQETSGWKIKKDGSFSRKDNSIVTRGDLVKQAPVMFGIYSIVTDPEKQLEDLMEHMKANPKAPDVMEVMKSGELQDAVFAKLNPDADQAPYTNFLIKQIEGKIKTGHQVSAELESRGADASRIDKLITRYEKKLTKLTTDKGMTHEQQINYNQELVKHVDDQVLDWVKKDSATPEQTTLFRNNAAEQYKMRTIPNYKTSKKVMVRAGTDKETGKRVFANTDGERFWDMGGSKPYKKPARNDSRADGTKKGPGFLKTLKMTDGSGKTMTELSVGVNIDGKETEIPTLVPTLTKKEISHLRAGNEPTQTIMDKAIKHAKQRIKEGKSPFYQEGEKRKRKEVKGHRGFLPQIEATGRFAKKVGRRIVERANVSPEKLSRYSERMSRLR